MSSRYGVVILVVNVDDNIVTGNNLQMIIQTKQCLKDAFQIKDLGSLHYFLGIEVVRTKNKLNPSQRKYTLDLLQETGMLDSKPTETPKDSSLKLTIEEGDLFGDCACYRQLIGKLIYLTMTRSDISFIISVLSQFMDAPKVCH